MTSTTGVMNENGTRYKGGSCCGFGANANWSGINIAAMVIGFVVFWPIGLFMLYWILKGRNVADVGNRIAEKWHDASPRERTATSRFDNEVFNEFQQTQYDRIREIKDEIKDRSRRFAEFRSDAKRRADKEEFNRFMDDSPS